MRFAKLNYKNIKWYNASSLTCDTLQAKSQFGSLRYQNNQKIFKKTYTNFEIVCYNMIIHKECARDQTQ